MIYILNPGSVAFIKKAGRIDEAIEALACDTTGRLKTPRLPPGNYSIVVESYKPRPRGRRINRFQAGDYRVVSSVTVPAQGPANRVRIEMPAPPDGGVQGAGARNEPGGSIDHRINRHVPQRQP